ARHDVGPLTLDDRRSGWQRALEASAASLNGQLDETITHFAHGLSELEQAGAAARRAIREGEEPTRAVWRASRGLNRPRLGELAERIEPAAGWRQLVLPERETGILRLIAANVRRRHRVHRDWGLEDGAAR